MHVHLLCTEKDERVISLTDLPFDILTASRFGCAGLVKLGQTCRALQDATAFDRRVLSGRLIVYNPPLDGAILDYMMKYIFKDSRSAVETMLFHSIMLDARHHHGQLYVLLSRGWAWSRTRSAFVLNMIQRVSCVLN